MDNLYKFIEPSNPFHVSVGAVLFNDAYEVCVHKYYRERMPEQVIHLSGGLDMSYFLMRETLHDDETPRAAVLRGIKEEFGATGTIERYLGAIVCPVTTKSGWEFEKTTLYHAVRLEHLGERDLEDVENFSDIKWLAPRVILQYMEEQEAATDRAEMREAVILRRFMDAYNLK